MPKFGDFFVCRWALVVLVLAG